MVSTGALQNSAVNRTAAPSTPQGTKFNSKLISGLKKNGNGIVVKVPAGVNSIKVRPMAAPGQSQVALSKAEPIRISFSNSAKDNFITLRVDQNGNLQASALEDMVAERELNSSLNGNTKVGIIDGENKRLNEKGNLRITEFMRGSGNTAKIKFLTAIKLTNASPRLNGIFKKFTSMKERNKDGIKASILKLIPNKRRDEGSKQGQGDGQQEQDNQPIQPRTKGNKFTPEQQRALNQRIITSAIISYRDKLSDENERLLTLSEKQTQGEEDQHSIEKSTDAIATYQNAIDLLCSEKPSVKNSVEYMKLMVSVYMSHKSGLYRELNAGNNKRFNLKRELKSVGDEEQEAIEHALQAQETQLEEIRQEIDHTDQLIRLSGRSG